MGDVNRLWVRSVAEEVRGNGFPTCGHVIDQRDELLLSWSAVVSVGHR